MADEMPFQIGRQGVNFRQGVLNAVFTKNTLPGFDGLPDDFRRVGFRDGHEFDFLRAPTGAGGGGGDLRVDGGETVGDFVHLGN